jgi:hypothetical protein
VPNSGTYQFFTGTCQRHNTVLTPIYTPGQTNTISDFLSHSFHLSDAVALHKLQSLAPTQPPWRLVTPTDDSISMMNLALSRMMLPRPSPMAEQPAMTPPGPSGPSSASASPAIPSCPKSTTPSCSYRYSLQDTEWERWLPPTLPSALAQWKAPFMLRDRRFLFWDTKTPAFKRQAS